MSFNLVEYTLSFPANQDLNGYQYHFVTQDGTGVRAPSSKNEFTLGVLTNQPSTAIAGSTVTGIAPYGPIPPAVCIQGVTRLAMAGAYAAGSFIVPFYSGTAADNGLGTTVINGDQTSNTKYIRAKTLQASTAKYDVVAVQMIGPFPGTDSSAIPS
jgi:hypothetical protein